jgi:hypothetical protein
MRTVALMTIRGAMHKVFCGAPDETVVPLAAIMMNRLPRFSIKV